MFIPKPKKTVILLISFISIFLLSGCYLIPEEKKVIQPSLINPPKITYDTITVERGSVEKNMILTGYFTPTSSVEAYFALAEGRISMINKFIGDMVKEGDIMV